MTVQDRLWQRHQERVEKGARRLVEQRRRLIDVLGEGGQKLTQAEQAQMYEELAFDPEGQRMGEVLMRRQKVNRMKPTEIPRDWLDWDRNSWQKLQAQS